MSVRTIEIPAVLDIRPGALSDLAGTAAAALDTRRVVVVTGGPVSTAYAAKVAADLEGVGAAVELRAGVAGTRAEAVEVAELVGSHRATLVIGVGGGRPIDVAKLGAARGGTPFLAAPTALAHDGMSSPVASLADDDGVRRSLAARMPAGVVIDLDAVAGAPLAQARAGIGDLISNLTAVADWRLASTAGDETFDEFAASVALHSALPALDVSWPLSPFDNQIVARGLVMSGLAMEVAGSSRPCSGAEHLVSHALDQLLAGDARPHGEQVALGVLVMAGPSGVPVDRIRALYERIGLPTTLEGWGIPVATLVEAVAMAPSMRPDRLTVLDQLDLSPAGIDALLEGAFGAAGPPR